MAESKQTSVGWMHGLRSYEWRPKGTCRAVVFLTWVAFLHVAGVYLFTRGFLLTRMSLSDINTCTGDDCRLPPTHQRLVLLIVDALRFDFVTPDAPEPHSPYHHNVLTLPRELSAKYPANSFLFNTFSDPPTTTMQRIKGITTGSLPTFVDMSANFGATSIDEDSLVLQLRRAGKTAAFMGDDTWMSVFPTLFAPNMTHPYDSFNVEDLHSVDNGVITHLFPLLRDTSKPWDALIGHFLGVDHVGHRVGPDHPLMRDKLAQMDGVLRNVVELLDRDTLLVVLGDHGMDRKGDHGGDDVFETSAAMWVYSKRRRLRVQDYALGIPDALFPNATFPGASISHRRIQQIDIVPTLALLLGLPVPFNSLGSVIPELFARPLGGMDPKKAADCALARAMGANARQVRTYLSAYRASVSGKELEAVWPALESVWVDVEAEASAKGGKGHHDCGNVEAQYLYTRAALAACRSLWAQFDVVLMSAGLVVLLVGVGATAVAYARLGSVTDWERWAGKRVSKIVRHGLFGAIAAPLVYLPLRPSLPGIGVLDIVLIFSSLSSCAAIFLDSLPTVTLPRLSSLPLTLILHALSFLSNSFTFWEDRIVPFLLLSALAPAVLSGLAAPERRLRRRILVFSGVFAVCVRLIATSTVCREEQQPYCSVTFYTTASHAAPPRLIRALAVPAALLLPSIVRKVLAISASDRGIVPRFLTWFVRPALVGGAMCWVMEWMQSAEVGGPALAARLRTARSAVGWATFGTLALAVTVWFSRPLCVDIRRKDQALANGASVGASVSDKKDGTKTSVTFVINTNAYGAAILLFWAIALGVVFLTTQLTGQLVLIFTTIALLAHFELSDSLRDAHALRAAFAKEQLAAALELQRSGERNAPFTFVAHVAPLALLGAHTFFGTGHQAVLASLQWKTAFILHGTLRYPEAPLLVASNTLGGIFLCALAAPLLACWQVAPRPGERARAAVLGESVRAGLGVMLYYAVLLLSSTASAAWLRRHLMVWKVFAPRFMLAALSVLTVDLAVLVGVGVAVGRSTKVLGAVLDRMQEQKKPSKQE